MAALCFSISLLLLLPSLPIFLRWTSYKSHSFHVVSASQAPHGNRTLQPCPDLGEVVRVPPWTSLCQSPLADQKRSVLKSDQHCPGPQKCDWSQCSEFPKLCLCVKSWSGFLIRLPRWQIWTDFPNVPLVDFPLEYVNGSAVGNRNAMLTDLWCPVQFDFGTASCGHFHWRFLEQPMPAGGWARKACKKRCCFMEFHVKHRVRQECECVIRHFPD